MFVIDFSQLNLAVHKGMAQFARNVVPRLARRLEDAGLEFCVTTVRSEVDTANEILESWGVTSDALRVAKSLLSLYSSPFEARRLYGSNRVVFVSTYPRYPTWNKGKNIATIHDITAYKYSRWYFFGTKKDNSIRRCFTRMRLDSLVESKKSVLAVVSHTTVKDLSIQYLDLDLGDKAVYVGNGADHIILPQDDPISRKRESYFIYIGGSSLHKNLKNMIQGFKLFSDNNPNFKLKIAGSTRPQYIKRDHEEVEFLGPISEEEKRELIINAVGSLYLSFAEGFGIPPLESILLGTPVIVSDIEIFSETLPSWKLKANPFSCESISTSMLNLVSDHKLFIAEACKSRASLLSRFSWDVVASNYFSLIIENV